MIMMNASLQSLDGQALAHHAGGTNSWQVVRTLWFLLICVTATTAGVAQTYRLSGRVTDRETGGVLPSATVRVAGSSRGTISNIDGHYVLRLQPGPATLIFSYVGYRPDSVSLAVTGDRTLDVALTPVAIELQEIVVSDEDPAMRIMRRVIENKHLWKDSLRSYQFKAFTRQVLRRDTSIASITESFTHGYWRAGDTLREVVLQKRQTENIALGMNFAFVGQIQNFYDDDLDFFGFQFVGPTSSEAFEYYRFFLEAVKEVDGVPLYEIRMEPRSRVTPLFAGRLMVIGDSYALAGVEVTPNEAYVIPFLSELRINYSQGFNKYSERYWMPTDIRVSGSLEIGLVGISIPRVGFEQTSIIYDYTINVETPDSIFAKSRRIESPTAKTFDSTFWADNEVLPLTPEEHNAYVSIDSTQTLDKQFTPSGPLTVLADGGISALEYVDVRFNRTEGVFLGGKIAVDTMTSWLSASAKAGYGISDLRWKYSLGLKVFIDRSSDLAAGIDAYEDIRYVHDDLPFDALGVSLAALIAKNDPRDYYYARGFSPFVEISPLRQWDVQIRYREERHRTAEQNTDFSFFFRSRTYRPQPEVQEGMLRAAALMMRIGDDPVPFGLVSRNALEMAFEVSPGSAWGSDFTYTWLTLSGEYHIADFLTRNLIPPTLIVHASGGAAWGTVPPQRLFSLPSAVIGFGPIGVLKASRVKEFGGSRYLVLSVEQNFRSIPFLLLDIPFLYRNSIELLVHGSVARSWRGASGALAAPETGGWYGEAGIGIGKIFGFFRCDVTYRFFRPARFVFTAALSRIL